jgi:hypothetical protein
VENEHGNEEVDDKYELPNRESGEDAKMKNINPTILPHFYGFPTKNPYIFLFKFKYYVEHMNTKLRLRNCTCFPQC